MYCAYITTLKNLRKHDNADRLQCATVFGNNVIVDLSYKNGQKVVYFPTDGQLGKEFAEENNLVRKKDEHGNNIGGYLDPDKRNITALKLRGEKSDGLVLPIEVLSKYTDIEQLMDGEQITTLNGTEICRKYIPRANHRNPNPKSGNGKKRNPKEEKLKISYPFFVEHIDTQQLAYNEKAFKPGDTCYITLKMHGCFARGTKVRMADGKLKRIESIKEGDYVLSYDMDNKQFVSSKVTKKFRNAKSNNWREIKISRDGMQGDKRGKIVATYNHPFWDNTNQQWIPAENLQVGMNIDVIMPSYILSKEQKEILIGNFLGDGCLMSYHNKSADVELSCKYDNREYTDFLINITGGLYKKNNTIYTSGYGSQIVRIKTLRSADLFNFFYDVCSMNNRSINKLKSSIVDVFSERSMAMFYMEDGSIVHSDNENEQAMFAICDYGDSDAQIISNCFKKFNINPVIYTDSMGYKRLRINHKDADKMFYLICQYIPPIMQYKLPERYRNKYQEHKYSGTTSYTFVHQTVLENKLSSKMQVEHDMETEYHNYIVGNSIVHNTSARTMNAVEVTTKKKPKIIKKLFHAKDKQIKTYKFVSGTRRCTLRDYEGGWYGSNAFREKYHDFFKTRLPKGVEIFYEIVGYVNESTPIMGRCSNKLIKDKEFTKQYGDTTTFSYGCDVGENDCYVYRMTMTNEDGYAVEIPWEQVQIECEKMGAKCVPLFEKFTFTTWDDLMERVEKYYDGADPIGKTHIREGVVVRIDNRPTFTAYKHKNWSFKVLESIIKDTSDAPDMEEAEELITEELTS